MTDAASCGFDPSLLRTTRIVVNLWIISSIGVRSSGGKYPDADDVVTTNAWLMSLKDELGDDTARMVAERNDFSFVSSVSYIRSLEGIILLFIVIHVLLFIIKFYLFHILKRRNTNTLDNNYYDWKVGSNVA